MADREFVLAAVNQGDWSTLAAFEYAVKALTADQEVELAAMAPMEDSGTGMTKNEPFMDSENLGAAATPGTKALMEEAGTGMTKNEPFMDSENLGAAAKPGIMARMEESGTGMTENELIKNLGATAKPVANTGDLEGTYTRGGDVMAEARCWIAALGASKHNPGGSDGCDEQLKTGAKHFRPADDPHGKGQCKSSNLDEAAADEGSPQAQCSTLLGATSPCAGAGKSRSCRRRRRRRADPDEPLLEAALALAAKERDEACICGSAMERGKPGGMCSLCVRVPGAYSCGDMKCGFMLCEPCYSRVSFEAEVEAKNELTSNLDGSVDPGTERSKHEACMEALDAGGSAMAKDNNFFGIFDLDGIRWAPGGAPLIEVVFEADACVSTTCL